MLTYRAAGLLFATFLALPACGDDGDDGPPAEPLFLEDYAATFTEVRDCRGSADHDLNRIRILASPNAVAPYRDRQEPFPPGAVVLKEEYDIADTDCTGEILQWTVMVRLEEGSAPEEQLGWAWQRVGVDRTVHEENAPRCTACHSACGVPPDGYEGTCAVE
ncbi:MAG TPA: cytochrome P460 family protein [Kofleriaceae bacterium]|nr:cytochrome P460 family protein [Kofleriaceae bacterium]